MIKLLNEDCLKTLTSIGDETIDLIITDPPYLVNYKTNYRKNKKHRFCSTIQNDDNPSLLSNTIKELYRVMKPNSAGYMFCSSSKIDFFKTELERYFKIKNIIIWVKNNWTAGDLKAAFGRQYEMIILFNKGRKPLNGKRLTDVWNFDRVSGARQTHQNEKPVELLKQMVYSHSNEGDLIFDPFMGSGSTADACAQTRRNFIGCEIDAEFFGLCKKRLSGYEDITF